MWIGAPRQTHRDLLLHAVLSWICAGHIITGLAALVSGKRAIRLGATLYRANFSPSKQFEVIVRPLGAYILALAFLQARALREPERYAAVLDATLLVFALRQIERALYASDVQDAFGIPPEAHARTTWYFRALAAALLFARLRPRSGYGAFARGRFR
ncbi:MAG TPA: hypothetical protein VF937_11585 [Chloroflexota bacterium]